MDAPNLSWRKLNGSVLTDPITLFDAQVVDAGSDSAGQVFYLFNNFKASNNVVGVLNITGLVGASALNGKYIDFSSPRINYRLWFNVDNANAQPVANTRTLIAVALSSGTHTTGDLVALQTKLALNAVTESFDNNGDGSNETVNPFSANNVTNSLTVTMSYAGSCRSASNGTASQLTVVQTTAGSGGHISDAINMSVTAVNASGFTGVADGTQAVLKVQFAVDDGSGNDVWGAYDPVTGAFVSTVDGVPNAFYAQVGSGGLLNLLSTRVYSRGCRYGGGGANDVTIPANNSTILPTLKGFSNSGSDVTVLDNYKSNYAKIRLVVHVQPNADAGQLDFITRSTYSYT